MGARRGKGQVRVCVRHPWKKYTFLFSGQFSPFIGAFFIYGTRSRPKVRGTADVGWRSLFPLPINTPRTHSRLYHHMCLRTDGQ